MHRLLGSDNPLQGVSHPMCDPDFFDAAARFGRRDAKRWLDDNPDRWRTDGLSEPEG